MHKSGAAVVAEDVEDGLLDLASVRLQALLSKDDAATTSVLDGVMKRLFDPEDRDNLTVSAFGSSL